MRARAATELYTRKQCKGEGMAEFISTLQRIATKAYPASPDIASETIIEHLKKGLVDEFSQNYVKMQLIRNQMITVDQLEKELCQMEEDPYTNQQSVLLQDDVTPADDGQTLSIGQLAELWVQSAVPPSGQVAQQAKLPIESVDQRTMVRCQCS